MDEARGERGSAPELDAAPWQTRARRSGVVYLLAAAALLVLFWGAVDLYLEASDPWLYARDAWRVADGTSFRLSDRNHPFTHRVGLLLPMAAIYRLFGVSERTSLLFPLLCALGIFVVVFAALRTSRGRLLAVALAVTCVPILRATVDLGSDLTGAAWMAVFAWCVAQREDSRADIVPPARAVTLGAAAAAAAALGFLAKETALWLVPFVLAVFVLDLRASRLRKTAAFYGALCAGLLLFAVGYAWFCWHAWGDPWVRFRSIEAVASFHGWGKRASWLTRLTIEPPPFFFGQFGLVAVCAVAGLVTLPKSAATWKAYTLVMAALVWIGPTSLSRYAPLPLTSRFVLPCVPGVIVLSALFLEQWLGAEQRWKRLVPAIVLGVAALSVIPFATRTLSSHPAEKVAMALVVERARETPLLPLTLVCADSRSPEYVSMYFGFQPPENFRALFFPDYQRAKSSAKPERVLGFINEKRSKFLSLTYGKPTYDSELDALSRTRLLSHGGIRVSWLSE